MSLYESILTHANVHKWGFAQRFAPFYIISGMCHMINLANFKNEFYYEAGLLGNLRAHSLLVAPPGHSKTFFLRQFVLGDFSIFGGSCVECAYQGSLTEAGFVGTIKSIEGAIKTVEGAASEYNQHLMGIDEFSALTNSMKMEHSLNLDNAFLTALDSGRLCKRLAHGELKYVTNLTILTGSQPARFDLSSGLGRRFIFMLFLPSKKDRDYLRNVRRNAINIRPRLEDLRVIWDEIEEVNARLQEVEEITFDSQLRDFYDERDIPHFEETLYDRLALGYNIAQYKVEKKIHVKLDTTLIDILTNEFQWRKKIKIGPEDEQVMEVIREHEIIDMTELKNILLDFGITYNFAMTLIDSLKRQGRIGVTKERTGERTRPKEIVFLREN